MTHMDNDCANLEAFIAEEEEHVIAGGASVPLDVLSTQRDVLLHADVQALSVVLCVCIKW